MAKETIDEDVTEIKKEITNKKLLVGTNITLKNIMSKTIKKVFISSNCEKLTEQKITKYCKLANIPVQKLTQTNQLLGTLCKKPYSISVLGISR